MWILSLSVLVLGEVLFLYCLNKALVKASTLISHNHDDTQSFGSSELDLVLTLLWIWSASIAVFIIMSIYIHFSKIVDACLYLHHFSDCFIVMLFSLNIFKGLT
jgi:hypothetical protein